LENEKVSRQGAVVSGLASAGCDKTPRFAAMPFQQFHIGEGSIKINNLHHMAFHRMV
jgi:hypothetical protein